MERFLKIWLCPDLFAILADRRLGDTKDPGGFNLIHIMLFNKILRHEGPDCWANGPYGDFARDEQCFTEYPIILGKSI